MAKSKFTVSASLTILHPDGGRKLTKSVVARRVRALLEADGERAQSSDFEIQRAVVRDVDFD